MPIRGAFPTIHTNLWNPVASCRPCVLSPHLRIAPAPCLGAGGIGMSRRRPFIPLCQATPMQIIPPCRKQPTSSAPMGGSLNAGRGRSPYLLWKIVVFFVAAVLTFDNSHNNIPPTNPRRCSFKRVLTNYGAGTAVTNLTNCTGGTELRLFLSSAFSGSRPTNRQVQLIRRITIRRSEVIRFVGDLRGAFRRSIPLRPFLSTHQPNTYMNLPGAWVTRPGFRGRLPH